jgi:hypothetical protein
MLSHTMLAAHVARSPLAIVRNTGTDPRAAVTSPIVTNIGRDPFAARTAQVTRLWDAALIRQQAFAMLADLARGI